MAITLQTFDTTWQKMHNVCSATVYKWCTVASGTFKYVVPRL